MSDEHLDKAVQAASDWIATSPIKAVYEDADRIARAAVRGAAPYIEAKARAEERERLEAALLSEEAVERACAEIDWGSPNQFNPYAQQEEMLEALQAALASLPSPSDQATEQGEGR